MQHDAAVFFAWAETVANLPDFVRDEFDALLECGALARDFLRLGGGGDGHDKLLAFM